jgi:hypothetical protein
MSPDLKSVYFLIPATATSWFLMRASTTGGAARPIIFVEDYCVLWGGEQSGDVLTMTRHMGRPEEELTHWSYHVGPGLTRVRVGSVGSRERDGDFRQFVIAWIHGHGGNCEANTN